MKINNCTRLIILVVMFVCGFTNGKAMDITAPNPDDTPDRRTFGLVGNVKEVHRSVSDLSEENKGAPIIKDHMMTFDEQGRVTLDFYENAYVYDTKGNFIKGDKEYTKMERDENGRIKYYETRLDDEDPDCYRYTYKYDAKGRPTMINLQLWEGEYTDKLSYTDDNIYPDKIVTEGGEQGEDYTIVTTYEYKAFDKYGNWTERECLTESRIISEGDDSITQESTYTLEKRVIMYY